MPQKNNQSDSKIALTISALGGLVGGLCCLTPIVLVMFGLAGVSFAAGLGNVLYGEYRWVFRALGLLFVATGLVVYFRRKGVCTLDEAKRQRNRIINVSALVIAGFTGVYIFWTYVVLHYWGIFAGLPWAQYDESWAVPASIIIFALTAALAYRLRKSPESETGTEQRSEPQSRDAEFEPTSGD